MLLQILKLLHVSGMEQSLLNSVNHISSSPLLKFSIGKIRRERSPSNTNKRLQTLKNFKKNYFLFSFLSRSLSFYSFLFSSPICNQIKCKESGLGCWVACMEPRVKYYYGPICRWFKRNKKVFHVSVLSNQHIF